MLFAAADNFGSMWHEPLVLNILQHVFFGNMCNFYPKLRCLSIVLQSEKYLWSFSFLETVFKE